jgi:hypothetical protein
MRVEQAIMVVTMKDCDHCLVGDMITIEGDVPTFEKVCAMTFSKEFDRPGIDDMDSFDMHCNVAPFVVLGIHQILWMRPATGAEIERYKEFIAIDKGEAS